MDPLLFINILDNLDGQLLLLINSLHCPEADIFMKTVTNKWLWMPLSLVVAFFVIRAGGWRRGLLCMLCVGLAVAISDQVCASLLRPAIERLRPSNPLNPLSASVHLVNDYRSGQYGFPSCHASTTISIALMLALYFKRRAVTIALFGWVALMCYSRLYLGVHYPGDILGGFIIGSASALLCHWLYRRLCTLRIARLPRPSFRPPWLSRTARPAA